MLLHEDDCVDSDFFHHVNMPTILTCMNHRAMLPTCWHWHAFILWQQETQCILSKKEYDNFMIDHHDTPSDAPDAAVFVANLFALLPWMLRVVVSITMCRSCLLLKEYQEQATWFKRLVCPYRSSMTSSKLKGNKHVLLRCRWHEGQLPNAELNNDAPRSEQFSLWLLLCFWYTVGGQRGLPSTQR